MKKLLSLLLLLWSSHMAFANVGIAEKHVVILQPGMDMLHGSYLFGVRNDTEAEANLKIRIMFPEDMVDFKAEEGITADDLKLGEGGHVYLEKKFPPGMTLLGVSFQVKAKFGAADFNFLPESQVGELSVLLPKGSNMTLSGNDFIAVKEGEMTEQYEAFTTKTAINAGTPIKFVVNGVPKGRYGLWVAGTTVGIILLILAIAFTIKNREEVLAAIA